MNKLESWSDKIVGFLIDLQRNQAGDEHISWMRALMNYAAKPDSKGLPKDEAQKMAAEALSTSWKARLGSRR